MNRSKRWRGQIDLKSMATLAPLILTVLGWAVAFGVKQQSVSTLEDQITELKVKTTGLEGQIADLKDKTVTVDAQNAVRLERIETIVGDLRSSFDDFREHHR